ncbi:hypothetical protein BDR03DRAFT_955335 [Suillus americanus]|nr:hypothetical protein BDR03DRAFT_955335 [Suillus americanus]
MPTRAPPRRAIRAAIAARRCLSSSSGSCSISAASCWASCPPSRSARSGSPVAGGEDPWASIVPSWESTSSTGGDTGGGGFHLGLSAGLGRIGGGVPPPNAPFPWRAAMRSLRLPPLPMLSIASDADIPAVLRSDSGD